MQATTNNRQERRSVNAVLKSDGIYIEDCWISLIPINQKMIDCMIMLVLLLHVCYRQTFTDGLQ
jgi:hypothetical protein